jgi:hypothetical protein
MISDVSANIFEKLENNVQAGGTLLMRLDPVQWLNVAMIGAGGSSTLNGFRQLDKSWNTLKNGGWMSDPPQIVQDLSDKALDASKTMDFDIIVSGGTLGIFYAVALQLKGYKVCVIERNKIIGRAQEWNISRKELNALIRLGILTEKDIEIITGIEFNPVRVGFKTDTSDPSSTDGYEVYVNDILNLGVRPDVLIEQVKERFLAIGGRVVEFAKIQRLVTYSNGVEVCFSDGEKTTSSLTTRLVLDAMGNGSPVARQIRGAVQPDGICVVVGSCARGFDPRNNTYSDVIYTDTPLTRKAQSQLQYFWEAFPAGSGPADRTTYLFTYMDASPQRPSIEEILDDYWELLPRYQGVQVQDLDFKRVLYGMFPTYRYIAASMLASGLVYAPLPGRVPSNLPSRASCKWATPPASSRRSPLAASVV